MSNAVFIQDKPVKIPVPGNKRIEEFLGLISDGSGRYSVAHMMAPPHWGEPEQTPAFDEITILLQGRMQIESSSGTRILNAGEVALCKAGLTIRYSNPFDEPSEYWAICVPAFSPESANRAAL